MIHAAHYVSIPLSLGQCCGGGGDGGTSRTGGLMLVTLAIGTWILARWAWSVWTLRGVSNVTKGVRIAVIVVLALAVGAVVVAKRANGPSAASAGASPVAIGATDIPSAGKMPRLLDLGATACVPCKMMAPILEEMKTEFAGKMQVDFIDVWKNPAAGEPYGIDSIPTQIFFDASGKELGRHQGFISKADILTKWKQFGVEFTGVNQ